MSDTNIAKLALWLNTYLLTLHYVVTFRINENIHHILLSTSRGHVGVLPVEQPVRERPQVGQAEHEPVEVQSFRFRLSQFP